MIISSSSPTPALRRRVRPRTDVDLPEELMELILSKCPIKSVVRFKSVSKSWQSLISLPRFSKAHRIQRSKLLENENRFIILGKRGVLGERIYVVKSEEETIFDTSSISISKGIFRTESVLPYPSPIFNIPLCSCNGLILLTQNINQHYDYMYMLWNPSIRKHIIITAPPRPWLHRDVYYDSTTDDHRVVFSDGNCYTVYSCNRGNWSELEDFPRELTPPKYCSLGLSVDECFCEKQKYGVSVDGCFYRLANDNGEILCFDTRDGNLHKFHGPNNVERVVSLHAAYGRLYLYAYVRVDDQGFRRWAMEKHEKKKWVMDNKSSLCVIRRKLIDTENEEVADLRLADHEDGVSSVHTCGNYASYPSIQSRIFPYSENLLYMH